MLSSFPLPILAWLSLFELFELLAGLVTLLLLWLLAFDSFTADNLFDSSLSHNGSLLIKKEKIHW